jgi:hypothetical protein
MEEYLKERGNRQEQIKKGESMAKGQKPPCEHSRKEAVRLAEKQWEA